MTTAARSGRHLGRPSPSGRVDVIDILDRGLVTDIHLRVSLVGIELLTVDARIVVASVDTYLRFAEAVDRLDLADDKSGGLPELMPDMREGAARHKTRGVRGA
ncbi:gas vesicle protein GvpJ [Kitasatospora terrestris]|uniref:Gas vesicle protein A n=1 Tax=Kitasatospora terrestris TaxID=258051 RepID=A0ABP9EMP9_9ACTN